MLFLSSFCLFFKMSLGCKIFPIKIKVVLHNLFSCRSKYCLLIRELQTSCGRTKRQNGTQKIQTCYWHLLIGSLLFCNKKLWQQCHVILFHNPLQTLKWVHNKTKLRFWKHWLVFQFYTNLKVLGLVQNMSHYVCPKCQHKAYLFGQDGAKEVAKEMDLELLGTVCYMMDVLTKCDGCTEKVLVCTKETKDWHSASAVLSKFGYDWK